LPDDHHPTSRGESQLLHHARKLLPALAATAAVAAVSAPAASADTVPTIWLQNGVVSYTGVDDNDWLKATQNNARLLLQTESWHAPKFSANCSIGGGLGDWVVDCPVNSVQKITFSGGLGGDSFMNETGLPSEAHGGPGVDVFDGGDGVDVFYGDGDTDILDGGGGDDTIDGGSGADVIHVGDGDASVSGGSGNDKVYIDGHGADTVVGGSGQDTIYIESHSSTDSSVTTVNGDFTTITFGNHDSVTYSDVEHIVFHDQPH
jgi:Ca2+-binding RTX toxin-like protein